MSSRGRSFSRSRSYERRRSSRSPRRSPPRGGGFRGRGPPRGDTENQVYVARFGRRTNQDDLHKAFEKFGRIEKIDLKEGRGFGFIVSTLVTMGGMEEWMRAERRSRSLEHNHGRTPTFLFDTYYFSIKYSPLLFCRSFHFLIHF